MGVHSIVLGTINGIGRNAFDRLEKELYQYFEKIVWKDNSLTIKSTKIHANLRSIFHRIADHISRGQVGSLLYVGRGQVACIYFAHKKVAARLYREPSPPEWWHTDTDQPAASDKGREVP